jgi:hypothetical protein
MVARLIGLLWSDLGQHGAVNDNEQRSPLEGASRNALPAGRLHRLGVTLFCISNVFLVGLLLLSQEIANLAEQFVGFVRR